MTAAAKTCLPSGTKSKCWMVFPTNRMSVGLTLKGTALLVSGGYETDGETARGKLLDKNGFVEVDHGSGTKKAR